MVRHAMTTSDRNLPAIVGVGYSPISRRAGDTLGKVAVNVALEAIRDAGLTCSDIDGYVGSGIVNAQQSSKWDGIDHVSAHYVTSSLSLEHIAWAADIADMPAGLVVAAHHALSAGVCNYVLILRAHYNPPDRNYSAADDEFARGPNQFTLPFGIGPGGGRFAIMLQRYMYEYGAKRKDLFGIPFVARQNARKNPYAIWRDADELTLEQYLGSRWINEPMCILDCDMPVTGAGAFVLTTAERARDLRNKPAYVASYANANQPERVFHSIGITPNNINAAQIYDGYSFLVWLWLEKLGFCKKGEAFQFATRERIALGGDLPINTFGGSLGEGRLHGVGHVREAAVQIMGKAGDRQVPDMRYSLVQTGVPESSWTLVLSADPNS